MEASSRKFASRNSHLHTDSSSHTNQPSPQSSSTTHTRAQIIGHLGLNLFDRFPVDQTTVHDAAGPEIGESCVERHLLAHQPLDRVYRCTSLLALRQLGKDQKSFCSVASELHSCKGPVAHTHHRDTFSAGGVFIKHFQGNKALHDPPRDCCKDNTRSHHLIVSRNKPLASSHAIRLPKMSITASQSYASTAISTTSDHYPSPVPSPSTSGSMSRWKSVFKLGNGHKNGSTSKSNSARPSFLAGEGKENAFVSPEVDEMGKLPSRLQAQRANTEPPPAVYQQQVDHVDEVSPEDGEDEKTDVLEKDSSGSGSSFNVQLGAPVPSTSTSLHPTSPHLSTSHEATRLSRPYSTVASDTSRSSHSSSSRHAGPSSSNISPIHYATAHGASSASLYTTASSVTPHRNTLGLGFKSRIFSSPASAGAEAGSSFLSLSGSRSGKKEKKAGSSTSSRKKSVGGSSSSSHNTSPRTPHRFRPDGSNSARISPPDQEGTPTTPAKSSAAARFLRRVVSAPNTKALFGANNSPIPPLPTKSPGQPSPVVVIDSDASQIDLSASPPESAVDGQGSDSPITFTPSPHRVLPSSGNTGGLSATGTRAARSLTAGAAQKVDAQAALGVASISHHKQVFRRTYSSNSIKTRSVEVSPSSFQKIKLLGKGDVGKVYLVREKKTDKLFAMKGEFDASRSPISR